MIIPHSLVEIRSMSFTLPPLPFAQDALEPHISANTLSFHYGKHHAGYVTKLNAATEVPLGSYARAWVIYVVPHRLLFSRFFSAIIKRQGTDLAGKSLEELIKTQSGKIFNLSAQVLFFLFVIFCCSFFFCRRVSWFPFTIRSGTTPFTGTE